MSPSTQESSAARTRTSRSRRTPSRATIPRALAAAAVVALLAPAFPAQKMGRDYFEDAKYGYKFRYPKDWAAVPVKPELKQLGIAALFKGESISVNVDNQAYGWEPDLRVYVIEKEGPTTGEEATGLRARVKTTTASVVDRIAGMGLSDFQRDQPTVDDDKKIKKLTARHRVWNAGYPTSVGTLPMTIDVWSFSLDDRDVSLVFRMMDQRYKKWDKTFYAVAKTFAEIERKVTASVGSDSSYADLLRFYESEVARVPGWRVLPTDSRRFIVKTSSDNDKFVAETIDRLERSRDLFERDFPPEKPIEQVSVVRICGTEEEFHQYGQTGGGVAGWFNPSSKELVLYDASDIDRKVSYAVMTHEGFHQYCHFLFDQAEAHRWFDEGHGDYYGGFEFKGSKALVTPRMPSGLDRLGPLRQMVREEAWIPIEEHINYDHGQWQSHHIRSYAQSWSIIYMLRQGMLGEVNRKVWKPEYADIIPNYMATLHAGFQEAYAAKREEAKKAGREIDDADSIELDRGDRNKIWKKAIAESWGRIDIDEFEKDWLEYIDKYLDG